jgi:type III restriction enzyme
LILNDVNENGLTLYENRCYKVMGLPFYNDTLSDDFKNRFDELILNNISK